MELEAYLHQLFAYDDWANRETLASLEHAGKPSKRAKKLMAHIVAAEWLWMDRMAGRAQRTAVWPELSFGECREQLGLLQEAWRDFFANHATKLSAGFNYKNSQGENWSSHIGDAMMHVVMHSAYHRGQIAAEVRAAGGEPAYTDYIHAVRQSFIAAT